MAKKTKKTAKKVAATKKAPVAKKAAVKAKSKRPKLAKRVSDRLTNLLDRRLLDIATKQYARVLREVAKGRRRIDDEKKLAMQLGERIIAKAREVKASLTSK